MATGMVLELMRLEKKEETKDIEVHKPWIERKKLGISIDFRSI